MHFQLARLCVPTDFSDAAENALQYGVTLAEALSLELHVLHVLQDIGELIVHPDFTAHGETARAYFNELQRKEGAELLDDGAQTFLRQLEQGADEQFQQVSLGERLEKLGYIKAVRYGNPVEEICRYATNNKIDLLVLGTHGRTGLKRMLLGSVAERVVRAAPCPVLTVRDHQPHDVLHRD